MYEQLWKWLVRLGENGISICMHQELRIPAKNYSEVDLDQFCQTLIERDFAAVSSADYFSVDLAFRVKETLEN